MAELWFYVPDYPKVKERLEKAYDEFGMDEWSAEPGRCGGCPDDADVTVRAESWGWLAGFRTWCETGGLPPGSHVEGKNV